MASKLVHLKEFDWDDIPNSTDFRLMMESVFAKNLYKLNLVVNGWYEHLPFELFANLISLRHFRLGYLEGCRQLATIFNCLPLLESLDFTVFLNESDAEWLKDTFHALGQLKRLKKLNLGLALDRPVEFSFRVFQPMTSVTCLDVWLFHWCLHKVSEHDVMTSEIIDLPIVFPNLIHLKIHADNMPTRYLMSIVDRLHHLKILECKYIKLDYGLQKLCDEKNVKLKFFKPYV